MAHQAAPHTLRLSNGVEMPLVAFGTGGDSNGKATPAVHLALSEGFRHIDTAHDYGDIAGVASAIAAWGDPQVFLTSKVPGCGVPTQGLEPPCYDNTLKMASADVITLGGRVDLMLIHFPPILGCTKGCTKIQAQWAALESLYAANRTRAIGVSNMCVECLECILANSSVTPMVNQVQYHVGQGADPGGLISFSAKHGIVIEAYSPLAHGRVLNHFPEGLAIAKRSGFNSSAQVALSWIAQRGHALVTKASNATYLREDLNLWQGTLSTSDIATIDGLTQPACVEEAPGGCCHTTA